MTPATPDELVADADRLAAVLRSVGAHLDVEAVGTRPAGRRRLVLAAAAVLVLLGAVLAVAPARRVVSGWLGVGPIEVELVADRGETAGLPAFTDAVPALDPGVAAELLGRPLAELVDGPLGAPAHWWAPPEGGVLLGWADGAASLWVVATADGERLVKQVAAGASEVVEVPDLGDWALAVTGVHVVETPHRRVAAETVVAWTAGELTLRLESADELEPALRLARTLDAWLIETAPRS